ncbi:hypothetical protein ES708_25440 [subsurface metagenome]
MGTIEEIIKTIDDELIDSGKGYLLLVQANKLLANKGAISISEKIDQALKKILEENKIPHAYQTETKPIQWRIPLSDEGKIRKKSTKKKQIPKKQYQQENFNTLCPKCGINLFVPNEIVNEYYIQCLNCGKNFRNPLRNQNGFNNPYSFKLSKSQRNWIIGIIVIVVILVIGNLSDKDSTSTSSLYYINTTTYAATSKTNYDEMFRYISVGDEQALSSIMFYGQMKTLSAGTEVYLVNSHFSYCIVRLKGSTQHLWVVREHITKK